MVTDTWMSDLDWNQEEDEEIFLEELSDTERREIVEGYVRRRMNIDPLAYDYSTDDYPYGVD